MRRELVKKKKNNMMITINSCTPIQTQDNLLMKVSEGTEAENKVFVHTGEEEEVADETVIINSIVVKEMIQK